MSRIKKKQEPTPSIFGVGFSSISARAKKGKYLASCFNCKYFYQDKGDSEELCQNQNVLEYDMIKTPTSIYCNYWELFEGEKKPCRKEGLLNFLVKNKKRKLPKT